jgi:hypothetical protein
MLLFIFENLSAFEKEPIWMVVTPRVHAIVVLLNHHAEFNASLAIAVIAQLMHADHFSLARILRKSSRGKTGAYQQAEN